MSSAATIAAQRRRDAAAAAAATAAATAKAAAAAAAAKKQTQQQQGRQQPAEASSSSSSSPLPSANLNDRANRSGVSMDSTELEDDGDPGRRFTFVAAPYVVPKDILHLDETKAVDRENQRRHQMNLSQLEQLTLFFKRLGHSTFKIPPPPIYHDYAHTMFMQRLNVPDTKHLKAIEMLHEAGLKLGTDYEFADAVEQAEQLVGRRQYLNYTNAKPTTWLEFREVPGVPATHHITCDCQYRWDGFSPTCRGVRNPQTPGMPARTIRLAWYAAKDFHFMLPKFEIGVSMPD